MLNLSFLGRLAKEVIHDYHGNFSDVLIVLPSKRAKVFFIEALRQQIDSPILSPKVISIEDFVQNIADLRQIDSIELLFEFYEVFLENCSDSEDRSFEVFANWAKTLLQDFNEIDRYLIDPEKILKYLDNIKEIEHWSLGAEPKSELVQKHLIFWKALPKYYNALYTHLLEKGKAYQGMIYREAYKRVKEKRTTFEGQHIVFAGFNALNAAEEHIFQELQISNNAKIYWDIDEALLADTSHDAGLFIRKYKNNWPFYRSHQFEWPSNEFLKSKSIRIMGTPKSIGQAKLVGSIIENLKKQNPDNDLSRTAVVLAEENLLIPLLYSLPDCVDGLNITMGYSSKNNPAQVLVSKLFKLHINAEKRKGSQYTFYHTDLLDIITHPLIEPYIDCKALVETVKKNNISFISHSKLFELKGNPEELFHLLFDKWDAEVSAVLNRIAEVIRHIKAQLSNDDEEEKVTKTFLFSIYKVVNKLINYTVSYQEVSTIAIAYAVYKQIIDLAEVSFEGMPLSGLQVMGVLESRVLDFDTVIITSMNEGIFPAGKSNNSFIPYDVKREYILPTFKEKDAIYTYHFYHLIQRAKNIFLIYNTDSEGLTAGEKSRFITQLEFENHPNHKLTHEVFNAPTPVLAHQPRKIIKSDSVIQRLLEIAEKGFSPTALTSYIRNPMDFYFQNILKVREHEEVEENIAANTLGTIIHETLKSLYTPIEGRFLTEQILESFIDQIGEEVLKQFKVVYKEGEIKKGRNLLAFEVAKRHVHNFIKSELAAIKTGETVRIIAIERTYEKLLSHSSLPCPILIKGNVDRIEERNGIIRIIDYKTGKIEKNNIALKTWNGLTTDVKNDKIIQILAYASMYAEVAAKKNIEAGIISFKNLKSGFLPFTFKGGDVNSSIISEEILESYLNEIVSLFREIFDTEVPFEEKI